MGCPIGAAGRQVRPPARPAARQGFGFRFVSFSSSEYIRRLADPLRCPSCTCPRLVSVGFWGKKGCPDRLPAITSAPEHSLTGILAVCTASYKCGSPAGLNFSNRQRPKAWVATYLLAHRPTPFLRHAFQAQSIPQGGRCCESPGGGACHLDGFDLAQGHGREEGMLSNNNLLRIPLQSEA